MVSRTIWYISGIWFPLAKITLMKLSAPQKTPNCLHWHLQLIHAFGAICLTMNGAHMIGSLISSPACRCATLIFCWQNGWCQLSIKTLTLAGYCGAGHLAPSWFLWLPADSSSTIRSSRPVPSNSDSAGWKRKRSMHNTNVCFCSCELALKLRDDSIIESIVVPSLSTEVVKTPWTKPPQATLLLNLYCARVAARARYACPQLRMRTRIPAS